MSGAAVDLGTLLGGGVALLRRRPGAVLVWTLISVAGCAGADLVARQVMFVDPSGRSGGFFLFLINLLRALITPLLLTAAMRALLKPRETEFASLDAGMDEMRVIGISLILSIFFSIVSWISRLVLGGLVVATMSRAVAIVVLLVPLLIFACLFARLSLAYPLALIRKRIVLEEAWGLTERHFWPFFLAYAIIAVGMILASLAIAAATDWPSFATLMAGLPMLRIIVPVDALTILGWVLNGVQATLFVILAAGAMAAGAKGLVPDTAGLAETFS